MKITLTNEQGAMYNLEVSDDMDLASFKALCEVETSIPSTQINLFFEGKELDDDTRTLNNYNIQDGEVLLGKFCIVLISLILKYFNLNLSLSS